MRLAAVLGIVLVLATIAALAIFDIGPGPEGRDGATEAESEGDGGWIPPAMPLEDRGSIGTTGGSDEPQLSPELEEARRLLLEVMRQSIDGEQLSDRLLQMQARKDALEDLLATLGPEAVDMLVQLLIEEPDFINRRQIIYALGRIGSDPAANALVDHYWRLYGEEQEGELNHTIQALGIVQSEHSFGLLTQMIETEAAEPHRFRFVEQLGRHKENARAIPTFLAVAEEDGYFKTRSRAALALKWAGDPASAPQVERLLDSEQDKFVRQALCGTLGDLGDPASVNRLATIARTDTEHQTRMSAIRAMSRIATAEARQVIEERATADEHERVRIEAERALRRMDQGG